MENRLAKRLPIMTINWCHLERLVSVGLPIFYQRTFMIDIAPCTIATNAETIFGYAPGNVRPLVEVIGFEPMTSCLQGRCYTNWAIPPKTHNLKFNQSNYADVMILQTPLSLLSSQRYESILCIMATEVWFEHTIHRIKICCLTAWLLGNIREVLMSSVTSHAIPIVYKFSIRQ